MPRIVRVINVYAITLIVARIVARFSDLLET